jgi:hypothetical protein
MSQQESVDPSERESKRKALPADPEVGSSSSTSPAHAQKEGDAVHAKVSKLSPMELLGFNYVDEDGDLFEDDLGPNISNDHQQAAVSLASSSDGQLTSSESDSSSQPDEESQSKAAVEAVTKKYPIKGPAGDPSQIPIRHKETMMFHLPREDRISVVAWFEAMAVGLSEAQKAKPMRLACGRIITDKHQLLHAMPQFSYPRCSGCYGNSLFSLGGQREDTSSVPSTPSSASKAQGSTP